jgi:hypothetical protein
MLWPMLLAQSLKRCITEIGVPILKVICTIVHRNLTKWHSKNKCCIVSFCEQNAHIFWPFQFLLRRLSLVRDTPSFMYHMKILIFNGIFSFHIIKFSLTLLSEISARYIDLIENIPF